MIIFLHVAGIGQKGELMSRAIDADALEIEGWSLHRNIQVDKNTFEYQIKSLKQVPTIEPEYREIDFVQQHKKLPVNLQLERKKGKWIKITTGAMREKYMCSICGRTIEEDGIEGLVRIRYPFCHCGAEMTEE